jgi:NitT/TauT family transport system substrate-binding protein
MTLVMSGGLDVGYDGNAGLGVPEFEKGQVRVVAWGSELAMMKNVTVRGLVVPNDVLAERRDVLVRFVQAYQKTVDWMYKDPVARQWYADDNKAPLAAAGAVVDAMYPEASMQVGDIDNIDVSIAQGIQFKRIDRQPTEDELKRMFDVVWKPGTS